MNGDLILNIALVIAFVLIGGVFARAYGATSIAPSVAPL
jgi:hypothetical protein